MAITMHRTGTLTSIRCMRLASLHAGTSTAWTDRVGRGPGRSAMTERKPAVMPVGNWIEGQILKAQSEGTFDNLDPAAEPLDGMDGPIILTGG